MPGPQFAQGSLNIRTPNVQDFAPSIGQALLQGLAAGAGRGIERRQDRQLEEKKLESEEKTREINAKLLNARIAVGKISAIQGLEEAGVVPKGTTSKIAQQMSGELGFEVPAQGPNLGERLGQGVNDFIKNVTGGAAANPQEAKKEAVKAGGRAALNTRLRPEMSLGNLSAMMTPGMSTLLSLMNAAGTFLPGQRQPAVQPAAEEETTEEEAALNAAFGL